MCRFTEKINEEYYLKCLEYAKVSILVIQDFKVQYYNPNTGYLFGYSNEEIEDDDFLKKIISNEEDYIRLKDLSEKRKNGYVNEEHYTLELKHKNNDIIVIDVVCYGATWKDKSASLLFFWDITLEYQLELKELHYKYIFDNSYRAIDVCNINGVIVDMNKMSEELWNINKEDFINKVNFFELERVKTHKNFADRINIALATKTPQIIDCYQTINNSGRIKWVSTLIYPIVTKVGKVSHFVVINDDLTDKKRHEEEKEALYNDLVYKNHIFESLGFISSILLDCYDPDSTINQVLQIIGETLNVSRTYIYEITPPKHTIICRYEWTNYNISQQINNPNIQNKSLEELNLNHLIDNIHNKKPLIINDINLLTEKDQLELLKQSDVKSLLIIPIYLPNNKLYGLIGFDECKRQRNWRESEVSILKNISGLMGSYIRKCYYEKRLDKFIEDQNIILNNLDSYVWFFRDIRTYGFMNNKYYNDFIHQQDSDKNKTFIGDCLIEDCHYQEESLKHIETNKQVFVTKKPLIYNQWVSDVNNVLRLLAIKKIPVIEDDIVKYIVCLASDITEKYNEEREILSNFASIVQKQMTRIDKNLYDVNKKLEESKKMTRSFIQ